MDSVGDEPSKADPNRGGRRKSMAFFMGNDAIQNLQIDVDLNDVSDMNADLRSIAGPQGLQSIKAGLQNRLAEQGIHSNRSDEDLMSSAKKHHGSAGGRLSSLKKPRSRFLSSLCHSISVDMFDRCS